MPAIRLADIPNAGPQALGPSTGLLAPRAAQLGNAAAMNPQALKGVAQDMRLQTYNLDSFSGEAKGMAKMGDALGDVSTVGLRFSNKMAEAKDDADIEKARTILSKAALIQENEQRNLPPEKWGEHFQELQGKIKSDVQNIGFSKNAGAKFDAFYQGWSMQTGLRIEGMANKEKIDGYKQDAKIGYMRELAAGNEQGAISIVNRFRANGTLSEQDAKDFLGDIDIKAIHLAEQRQTNIINADMVSDWTTAKTNLDKYATSEKDPDAKVDGPYGVMPMTKVKRLLSEVDRQGKYVEATNYNTLAQAIDGNSPVKLKNGDEILISDNAKLDQAVNDIKVTDPAALKRLRLLVSDNVAYNPQAVSSVNARLANYDPSTDPTMSEFNAISNDIASNVPKNLRSVMQSDLTSAWTKFSKDGTTDPKKKWQGDKISQINDLAKNGVLGDMGTEKKNGLFTDKIKDLTKYNDGWNKIVNLQNEMRAYFADPKNKDVTPEQATQYLNSRIVPLIQESTKNAWGENKPKAMGYVVPVGMGGVYVPPVASPTPSTDREQKAREKAKEVKSEGKVTSYNFPGDTFSDANSRNWKGAWNNRLTENSLAVSPDIERKFKSAGIGKGDPVEMRLADGSTVIRNWDDRTSDKLTGRFDFHSPSGKQKNDGMAVVSFRKANNA